MRAPSSAAPVSHSARRLAASMLALGRIRLELFTIELHEEKQRVIRLIFWSVLSALLAGFGLVFIAMLATVLLWDTPQRSLAIGLGAAVFIVLAIYGAAKIRRLAGDGTSLFQSSLGELRADEATLRPPAAEPAAGSTTP